jgi:O-antigen/teichoic acid export membrane protein
MVISLFTSRVILQTLGVEDYGVYGVVGGVVGMFGFFNSSLSGATSRFLSFELGMDNKLRLRETFSTALILHLGIALLVALLCETIGLWFLENKLVIPGGRMVAAQWVLQLSILSMIINVVQVPYTALIISHERMGIFAYIEIANSVLRLVIVYLLVKGNLDKLILYAILTCAVSVVIALVYAVVCLRSFEECHFSFIWKLELLKPMLSYSGWEFFGNMSLIAITQGVNMLLNMWYGPVMNAAYDISNRVKGIIMNLSTNVTTAIRPQIVKCYSVQEFSRMTNLMRNGSRITFLLMLLVAVPLIVEAHYILNIWLGIVPEHSETLLRLCLLWNLVVSMSLQLNDVVHATGDVKFQSIVPGIMYLSILPITYGAFKLGAPYWLPFLLNVFAVISAPLYSSYTIKKHVPGFSFTKEVMPDVLRDYLVMSIVMGATFLITLYMDESFLRLVLTTITSTLIVCLLGYYVVLPKDMQSKVVTAIKNKILNKYVDKKNNF